MFCPNCKCEYIRGVTQCTDCGVALVDELEPSAAVSQSDLEVVSVWEGNDPAEAAAVKDILQKAGIPVLDQGPTGYFIFPSMRPKTEICVSSAYAEQAAKVLLEAQADEDPEEMTSEERDSLALPESDDSNDNGQTDAEPELPENWNEDDPASEVWKGDSEEFADTLLSCFREVGMASRKLQEASHWSVVVRPEQESRAKEIVREVVEGSPPE
jgi:hypothetical protein